MRDARRRGVTTTERESCMVEEFAGWEKVLAMSDLNLSPTMDLSAS